MTEREIKKIVQLEIKTCFEQLTSDVKDIKQALLGNDYNKGGLVSLVQAHEAYIQRNKTSRVAERGLKVISWYEGLAEKKGTDGKSELERLEDGIQAIESISTLKKWLAFFGVTNVAALIALILEKIF